jgi:outer membrane protein assembly factor BamB
MRNKADELLWIGDSVVIAVDFAGFVNKTAKLQAFRAADLTELWYTEVPVGKRQRFEGALWFDKQAGVMFLGHGPFSAVDLRDGTVLWSIPYDTIGFVHDVLFGTERLLVLGSERISSFRLQWSLSPEKAQEKAQQAGSGYEHLDKPILFSLDRKTGKIGWEYAFEPGKEHKKKKSDWGGGKMVYKEREPTRLQIIGVSNKPGENTLSQGLVIVQAKHLGCVDLATGREIWRVKEDFVGEPQVVDNRILVIKEDRVVALKSADGSELWRSKDKVNSFWAAPAPFLVYDDRILVNCGGKIRVLDGKTGKETIKSQKDVGDFTIFSLALDNGDPICVFPGKYDQSKGGYKGDYRICRVSLSDGAIVWQFNKGKNWVNCDLGPKGCIQLVDKDKMWRLDISTGKVLCECRVGDGIVLSDLEAPTVLDKDGLRCLTPDGKKEAWRYKVKLSNEGLGSSFYFGSTLIMATKKEGLQAIDLNSGTVRWSIPIEKSGMIEASESSSLVALVAGKELSVINLAF